LRTIETLLSAAERFRRERGQVLVLAALLLTTLLLFTGFAIDVGIVYDARRDLVRVADAAALSGAGALSSGEPGQANDWVRQQRAVARVREYVELNAFDPDEAGNRLDVAVTFEGGKHVTVNATRTVPLLFMRLIGIDEVPVSASSDGRVAEAAPVDIVLVQDVSASQCFGTYAPKPAGQDCEFIYQPGYTNPDSSSDADRARLDPYDPTQPTVLSLSYRWISGYPGCRRHFTTDTWESCSLSAHSGHSSDINQPWEPFSLQQTAARYFVSQLDARYDQVGVVSFSWNYAAHSGDPYGADYNARLWQGLTSNVTAASDAIGNSPLIEGQTGDEGLYPGGNTNMAAGIRAGAAELTNYARARENAVPVMILLSDGAPTTTLGGTRPSTCYEEDSPGCSPARQDAMDEAEAAADKGVIIYTVFVGTSYHASRFALMLQYIADLTDNLSSGGPAYDTAWFQANVSENFFVAGTQAELERVYDEILARIYTRLVR
jgi:hypothetical protein